MPYANNQGIRINYEVEGEGPPLVLQHGLGGNLGQWHDTGYPEALRDDYSLILVDARGHGASDKPHDLEAYKMELRVADVVAVLDDLAVSKAHYLGYSMGGYIGCGIAKYAPQRFRSLIIGGWSLYGSAPEGLSFFELFKQGMEATLDAAEEMFGQRWTPEAKAMMSANDLEALSALVSVEEELGFEEVLPSVTLPCLLFGGDADPFYSGAEEYSKLMPNATFVSLPGLDHIEPIYRADLVLPHVKKFLKSVGQP